MPRSRCADHPNYTRGCPACRKAAREYRATRVAGLADGSWERQIASPDLCERGRQHLRSLLAVKGVNSERITVVAGISISTLRRIAATGLPWGASPTSIEALLGVTAEACLELIDRSTTPVDPIGTTRRLQALAKDGWDTRTLSALVGMDPSMVRIHRVGRSPEITMGTRERYRELYDKIQSQADPRGDSLRAAQHAEREGWLGPERWADGDIDNPDALPLPPAPETDDWVEVSRMVEGALRDPRPGNAADYPRSVQREIARQASVRLGWSYPRIAELLGKNNDNAIDYLLNGRKDRREARKLKKDGS